MFESEKYVKVRCDGCKYRRRVYAQNNYSFYGCYHRPYIGKRVAEIKYCPAHRIKVGTGRGGCDNNGND